MALLYAIVDSENELNRMVELSVPIIQFRAKSGQKLKKLPNCQSKIIINDSLEEAERLGAWGAHLGQEDLQRYDESVLLNRKVKLGISTHSDEEYQRALIYKPEYLGFGPIFKTSSKDITIEPHGVNKLAEYVSRSSIPVVAIGGINFENSKELLRTKIWSVAVIQALKDMKDEQIKDWMKALC